MTGELRTRLRRLADDCEERARRADSADARSLFNQTAMLARRASQQPYQTERDLQGWLDAMSAQAGVARFLDGDPVDHATFQPSRRPAPLLGARQLADLFGMTERGARKAIERGHSRRLHGFHRDGKRWLAERDAFSSLIDNQRG